VDTLPAISLADMSPSQLPLPFIQNFMPGIGLSLYDRYDEKLAHRLIRHCYLEYLGARTISSLGGSKWLFFLASHSGCMLRGLP